MAKKGKGEREVARENWGERGGERAREREAKRVPLPVAGADTGRSVREEEH